MKCKPTVKDVYNYIDSIAPFNTQCEWDNCGIIVGDSLNEVNKIAVVLDITPEAIEKAAEFNADLIISHHPVIFKAVKRFTDNDPAFLLAKHGIAAICAHTSLDAAAGGVNDTLAAMLGFEASPMTECGEAAMVRVTLTNETTGVELAKLCVEKLKTGVRLADSGKKIRKIAFCGGGGACFINDVCAAGCDAYITGDASHHEFLDAKALGLTLIAAGHFETENPVVAALAEKLKENFEAEVVIIEQSSPVTYHI